MIGPLREGVDFGPYRLRHRLGGLRTAVFTAVRRDDGRWVALKVLGPDPAAPATTGRFAREIEALRAVEHRAIPSLLDSGEVEGLRFFAVEHIDGSDLADLLGDIRPPCRTGHGLDFDVLDAFADLADAAHALHRAGFVHRDIQPTNIRIDREGRAWLLDLGLVGREQADEQAITRTRELVGTPTTLAPEQIEPQIGEVGPASDVYGLAATLFWTVTGCPPFLATSPARLLDRIVRAPRPALDARRHGLPAGLSTVLERALAQSPGDRYPDASAFAADLRRLRDGLPPSDPPRRRWRAVPRLGDRRRARSSFALLALTLFALVAVAGFGREADVEAIAADLEAVLEAQGAMPAWRDVDERELRAWLVRAEATAARSRDLPAATTTPGIRALRERIDADRTHLAQVLVPRARLWSRRLHVWRQRLATSDRDAWRAASARLAADPRFDGFALLPDPGLVPLGRDPHSGLEWCHDLALAAGHANTLPAPGRAADGTLDLRAEHGVVLALLPPTRPGAHPLWFAVHELTRAQWRRLTGRPEPNRYRAGDLTTGGDPQLGPVMAVGWDDAMHALQGYGYRLPSRAEWWHAATGGGEAPRPEAEARAYAHLANLRDGVGLRPSRRTAGNGPWDDGFAYDAAAGSLAPGAFGLHDLFGNAREWVSDAVGSTDADPIRLAMGGAWNDPPHTALDPAGRGFPGGDATDSTGVRPVRPARGRD